MFRPLLPLSLLAVFVWSGPVAAQPAGTHEEVLRLVPPDFGLCVVAWNLPAKLEQCQRAPWFGQLKQSPVAKDLLASPEFGQLLKLHEELPRILGVEWPRLRDDLFGDVIIFAHRTGPVGRPEEEQGLLLLRARQADLLSQVIDRLNQVQKKAGELTELTEVTYQGVRYFRRLEEAKKGNSPKKSFYWLNGSLLAFANKEDTIRRIIDRHQSISGETSLPGKHLRQAAIERALAAMWVNPRAVDADLQHKAKTSNEVEAAGVRAFLRYWQALDGMVLSLVAGETVDVQLTLLGRSRDLPAAAQRVLREGMSPSDLWQRFPTPAMVRLAGRVDALALTEVVGEFAPPLVRQKAADAFQRALGAAFGLDPFKDILPQLGPDWGLCIAPAQGKDFPHALLALAVRPGNPDAPVDQTIVKAIHFFAGIALFEYNRTHPDPIRVKTVKQDNVEIKYLENDKVFPSGCQPALALKDGYLLLASSPEAIRQFRPRPPVETDAVNLLDVSLGETARWLRGRREKVIPFLAEKNQVTPQQAAQNLEGFLAL